MHINWEGVYPAATTKFTSDEQLDIKAFEHNLDVQINAGIDAIVLAGSLGEASTLSEEDKNTILAAALEVSNGRVPILMNIAEQRTTEAVRLAQQAEKRGAHGLMLLPPMKYNPGPRETVTYFRTVAEATRLPIMIYNNPVDYKVHVTIDMFKQMVDLSNIQAVKESTRDVTNVTRMRNALGDRIKILCGVDTLAFECLAAGADGWVAGLVNAFPRETVVIYKLVKANRIQEALEIYRWFMPLLELDIHPKLVQYIKLAEVATGIGTEHTRAPRLPLVGEERERVLAIINEGVATCPDLSKYANL